MRILGIETSCDETSAAIVEDGTKILVNVIASSLPIHAKTGGIIPEIAAREQVKAMVPTLEEAFHSSRLTHHNIDAIAVTYGPGLIGSLLIGVETAKTLAYVWNKPLVPVNHLIGHIYSNWLGEQQPSFPNIALIVSGGHTELVLMEGHGKFKWLGGTRDDAAGEAFDKTARLLGLGYPGGPAIQKAAESGDPTKFNLPRPLSDSTDFDFSFSGLKTAVVNLVNKNKPKSHQEVADFSASIQEAIVDSLLIKTLKVAKKFEVSEILLGGGVAANNLLRKKAAEKFSGKITAGDPKLSVDNAAMIASAAYFNFKNVRWDKVKADPGILI
ncbi:MAG: tRNA (adenosine(37)-N6)-threonylcarbamoyltransferase complex transferase subunit TsaD [Candidatus Woykebacteria bacterium]